jgi:hypothetical protein
MMYVCATCGDIVSKDVVNFSAGVARCARCVEEGKIIKWPNVSVDSSAFRSLTTPERLHELSVAYLNSAMYLCQYIGENPNALDWPRASVVYFCLHHSIELFLKACILIRAPASEKLHHNIEKLQDRYCELYPDLKDEFHIESPWDIDLRSAAKEFGVSLNIQDFEYQSDQVYRYMTGKDGATTNSIHIFSPGSCLFMAERFQTDFARIWQAVSSQVSGAA